MCISGSVVWSCEVVQELCAEVHPRPERRVRSPTLNPPATARAAFLQHLAAHNPQAAAAILAQGGMVQGLPHGMLLPAQLGGAGVHVQGERSGCCWMAALPHSVRRQVLVHGSIALLLRHCRSCRTVPAPNWCHPLGRQRPS